MSAESEDTERVQKAIDDLSEFFDTIQIFSTRHEMGTEEGTVAISRGVGNWFARRGQIREWMICRDKGISQAVRIEEADAD